jgi:hypothetical protein
MKTFKQFYEQILQPGGSAPTNDPQSKQIRNTQKRLNDLMRKKLQQDNKNLNTAQAMREEISPALERLIMRRESQRQRTQEKLEANRARQEEIKQRREQEKQEKEREQEIIRQATANR